MNKEQMPEPTVMGAPVNGSDPSNGGDPSIAEETSPSPVLEETQGEDVSMTGAEEEAPAIEPQIGCDQAIDQRGAFAHNELILTGWAVSDAGVSGVVVQIEDRVYNATYGLDSPWVAANLDVEGGEQAGYQLKLDTSNWTPGPRDVTIAAYDSQGGRAEIAGRVEVIPFEHPEYTAEANLGAIASGKVAMWVDGPALIGPPAQTDLPLEINGWAHANGGLEAVIVSIDGRERIEALRPIVRPDLLDAYGPAVASGAGFVLRLHPSECPPGMHTITVVAIGRDGHAVGLSNDVYCHPAQPQPDAHGDVAEVEWLDRAAPQPKRQESPERYDPDLHGGSMIEAEHQLRYRWAAAIADDREVLDAACGVGWGSALLAEAGAKRVVGLDLSDEALAEARRRTSDLDVELRRGDLRELPFDDASFDLVTCFETIEHIADPDLALEELRRVLRPDGVLLISTPRRRYGHQDNVHHLHEYTPGEFERALRDRFASVSIRRQQTYLASAVVDDEALPIDDGTTDLEMDVRKLEENRPGGEWYTIAIASDGELPDLERMAVVASPHAIYRLHESAQRWEDRALLAEADGAATRVELQLARMQQTASATALQASEKRAKQAGKVEGERDEVRANLRASREELKGANDALESRREELERLCGELEESRRGETARASEIEQGELQLAKKDEELARQETLLAGQTASLNNRAIELRACEVRLAHAEARIASHEASISWRLTKPLRFAKRVLLGRPRNDG